VLTSFRANLVMALMALTPAASQYATADQHDENADQSRVYEGRSANVPLQPFSLDRPIEARRAIRVAYYAPQPVRRAEPSYSADDSNDTWRTGGANSGPTVPGTRAILRGGVAYAPAKAPDRVKAAIWAVNSIRHKPYHWGGGHGSFYDSGYDCSGTVSFALHSAGVLSQPLPSSDLLRFGESGRGRWITVYSRHGHTFAMIAGLRLDTTDFRYGGDVGPRWYTEGRSTWGFSARHPAGL
jgi:cell wall-associated NlpC family hydrolase